MAETTDKPAAKCLVSVYLEPVDFRVLRREAAHKGVAMTVLAAEWMQAGLKRAKKRQGA